LIAKADCFAGEDRKELKTQREGKGKKGLLGSQALPRRAINAGESIIFRQVKKGRGERVPKFRPAGGLEKIKK